MFIDLDTLDLTDFPDQDYSQYQNDNFWLPDAYNSNLNNDQLDVFPTLENYVEKQFEECKRIYKDVQKEIDKNDKNKQDILWEIWGKVVEKKNENDPEALIQLQQEMRNLQYSS